jgi:hypothetical protein
MAALAGLNPFAALTLKTGLLFLSGGSFTAFDRGTAEN